MHPFTRRLLRRTLATLLVGGALVALCSWFVDRPVAFFVHDRGLSQHRVFEWLTLPPPIVQSWSPVALVMAVVAQALASAQRAPRWTIVLIASCVALIVADQCCDSLRFVFGRDWPGTWIDNNQSLIANDAYGFHFLHGDEAYGSFPSGHMTRTLAFAAVIWMAAPRWRWACVAGALAIAIGLIGMNYHFVGDVIGGSVLGGVVGASVAAMCGFGRMIVLGPDDVDTAGP